VIDLHVHTNVSDGQFSPAETVNIAAETGVRILSITDHDTTAGVREGLEAAGRAGITLIPGIELSTDHHNELHILGYFIDIDNPKLIAASNGFGEEREERAERIFKYLWGKGVNITEESVYRHAAHSRLSRTHFAKALIEAGYITDFADGFRKYLSNGEFKLIDSPKYSAGECIDLIRGAGGAAVLAHPYTLYEDAAGLERIVRELKAAGLAGIECYYSSHSRKQTALYLALAAEIGLVATAGSDFHGIYVRPGVSIGTGTGRLNFTDESVVEELYKAR